MEIDSSRIDRPGKIDRIVNPYMNTQEMSDCEIERRNNAFYGAEYNEKGEQMVELKPVKLDRSSSVIRLPAFEKVGNDRALYAHASRVLHLETNPGNARALVQKHGNVDVWLNPPPIPLTTAEMDYVFDMPFKRVPHPRYKGRKSLRMR